MSDLMPCPFCGKPPRVFLDQVGCADKKCAGSMVLCWPQHWNTRQPAPSGNGWMPIADTLNEALSKVRAVLDDPVIEPESACVRAYQVARDAQAKYGAALIAHSHASPAPVPQGTCVCGETSARNCPEHQETQPLEAAKQGDWHTMDSAPYNGDVCWVRHEKYAWEALALWDGERGDWRDANDPGKGYHPTHWRQQISLAQPPASQGGAWRDAYEDWLKEPGTVKRDLTGSAWGTIFKAGWEAALAPSVKEKL